MDETSSELIHFVVVPVETVVACIYVLDNIVSFLPTDMSPPPTLKYVAIIEAHTDKAFFKFSPSDINEKKRKIINSAKDMCTQMVSKGYGGKVKRQDIMDTALNMAKK
ncbi:unnamed protein product [Alternaria alternata]|uniref:Uncharacterized protein n=1 Tax=Alternaria tenuissima TaxID=119927 RepID=A0AB37WS25_9PLEO|nr:hypothetical protein AALT_g2137 [Alternaria alternata]RYN34227.1 hypothetical protein AA0115_g2793 [Alternaria tenuissima]